MMDESTSVIILVGVLAIINFVSDESVVGAVSILLITGVVSVKDNSGFIIVVVFVLEKSDVVLDIADAADTVVLSKILLLVIKLISVCGESVSTVAETGLEVLFTDILD